MIPWGKALPGALAVLLFASTVAAETNNVLQVGVVRFAEPSPNAVIFDETFRAIERSPEGFRLDVRILPHAEFEAAVCAGSVDLFIASSGIYRRIVRCGARDLATAITPPYNDPNFSDGPAIVVLDERRDLQGLEDLRGKRLAVNATVTFSGCHVPLGEIAKLGVDPLNFFGKTTEVGIGASSLLVLNELKSGRADAAFLKQCLLEEHIRQHPAEQGLFRVLNRKDMEGECQRSTDLYPSWTIGSTRSTSPEVSRSVTSAILSMPAKSGTLRWGVATDYTRVDELFRTLRIGPYSYLREWTMKRFLAEFWPWLMLFAALVAGLVLHSLTVGKLVQKRTRELRATLNAYAQSQKEAAEATRRLETMQKIGVVNQLSSIVAHETRQPLGAISLYVDGLLTLLSEKSIDRKQFRDILLCIREQNLRVTAIVQKVRTYRKAMPNRGRPLDFSALFERESSNLARTLPAWKKVLHVDCEPGIVILGDELEIGLLVVNLLKNALESVESVEACGEGVVRAVLARRNGGAVLEIADNGTVETQDDIDRMSTDFVSEKPDGLGMGLSIVRGIAEKHKAKMHFSVNAPRGLRVTVTFGLAEE